MTLSEALQIVNAADPQARPFRILLACGFTPLHMQTFLAAYLQQRLPGRKIVITTGLYGDLPGTLRKEVSEVDGVAVVAEWADFDPRLGYRNLGGWGPLEEQDILRQYRASAVTLAAALRGVTVPAAVSLPTLPLPPAFHTTGSQAGRTQTALLAQAAQFAAQIVELPWITLVNPQCLDVSSPAASRLDLKSDLFAGLPYTLPHASAVAEQLARLLAPAPPKKGIITDLDDTLWRGIVGEVGPDAVTWDLHSHSQLHGLYQQVLRALADQGALVAIASKNDPSVTAQALNRDDLIVPGTRFFPTEVHWNPKSGSVANILKAWNIAADSVVFVDDSPMELEEVARAHPGIECILFPKGKPAEAASFLARLRDLFGKPGLSAEDALRQESVRQGAKFAEEASAAVSENFLRDLNPRIKVFRNAATDPRSLELVNKTNQFNLNGMRWDPAAWASAAARDGAFVWSVSYRDKFGPLGKIAVLFGRLQDEVLTVEGWVMSCRAFARRIEHQCLRLLLKDTGAEKIRFHYEPTQRNGPTQEFLGAILSPERELTRQDFERVCPELFHTIEWES